VENQTDLMQFLTELAQGKDSCLAERIAAKKRFHKNTTGSSAKEIADLLAGKYHM
jgi:hypothetical protein